MIMFKPNQTQLKLIQLFEPSISIKNKYSTSHWSDNYILFLSQKDKQIYIRITKDDTIIQLPFSNNKNIKENLYFYISKHKTFINTILNENSNFMLKKIEKDRFVLIDLNSSYYQFDKIQREEFINDFFFTNFKGKSNILDFVNHFYFIPAEILYDIDIKCEFIINNNNMYAKLKNEMIKISEGKSNVNYQNKCYISLLELYTIAFLLQNLQNKQKQDFYISASVYKNYMYVLVSENEDLTGFFYLKRIISKQLYNSKENLEIHA